MHSPDHALTFDDVLLLPKYSNILPNDTDLTTKLTAEISLNAPILSAAMDTVTESRLAIALAQEGGVGILHKSMAIADQAQEVRKVKRFESGVVKDPVTVTPTTQLRELIALTEAHNFSGMPVVEGDNLVGIITNRDVRFATNLDQPVKNLMTPKERLVTVEEGAPKEQVIALMHQHRIEKVLVIDPAFRLKGMITVKDILKAREKPLACKDDQGSLRVGAAVGTNPESYQRVEALAEAGVDLVVVDTAHGHSQGVLNMVRWVKDHFPELQVIGGNIATGDAALALKEAGADGVKVGMGPGSICITRVVAGIGVPQVTAIQHVANALKGSGIPLIADGGIRYSGDLCKAIAAGAWSVMIGGMFAGTEEAPGEVELFQGRAYKSYRGMGSIGAMAQRYSSKDRYFQDTSDAEKLVPEGIEGRVPYKGSLVNIVQQLLGGLRSCMGYTGCQTIQDLRETAEFVQITTAGYREGHAHDVAITKEAPNYQVAD